MDSFIYSSMYLFLYLFILKIYTYFHIYSYIYFSCMIIRWVGLANRSCLPLVQPNVGQRMLFFGHCVTVG